MCVSPCWYVSLNVTPMCTRMSTCTISVCLNWFPANRGCVDYWNATAAFSPRLCINLCVCLCAVWHNVCVHVCVTAWLSTVRVWYVSLATGAERCWHCLQKDTLQENEFIYPSSSSSRKHTKCHRAPQAHTETNVSANRQINMPAHIHLGGVWDLRHLAKANRGNCQPWHFFGAERGFSRWQLSLGVSGRWGLVLLNNQHAVIYCPCVSGNVHLCDSSVCVYVSVGGCQRQGRAYAVSCMGFSKTD